MGEGCCAVERCCPPFDPKPWDGTEHVWTDRLFVKDRIRSFFHVPLNFRGVMVRNMARIEAAGASAAENLVLTDENSLWGADVYIAVAKDVPGAAMARLSGRYLSRVFEGPYQDAGRWATEMPAWVRARGKAMKRLLFFWTTCPTCAAAYGKNYVVLLAEVG